ncbi:hypothetical protein GCM10020221_01870 [Streptomyces thioluteus]|uniref:Uncharacterized protein n=1 Tax=Streptomyces thioluteus TaxID=66431 RepID=A0ABN3WBH2_STRTU
MAGAADFAGTDPASAAFAVPAAFFPVVFFTAVFRAVFCAAAPPAAVFCAGAFFSAAFFVPAVAFAAPAPPDATFLADATFLVTVFFAEPAAATATAAHAFAPFEDSCAMAATPSHFMILRANRAGTINRPKARGNGARRSPPLCPAPGPVTEGADRGAGRSRYPVGRDGPRPVHWAQRKAWKGPVTPYAAISDPGTVRARGCARREDQPGAAGRTPCTGSVEPASRPQ